MKVEIPLMLRAKLGEPPFYNGIFTDFAPTLVRRHIGGTTEELRKIFGSKSIGGFLTEKI